MSLRRNLTQFDRSKIDAARGLRNALGVAVPLIAGALTGQVQPAIVVATGALNVAFADNVEPWQPRAPRMLAATLLVSLAVFCGSVSGWTLPPAVAAAILWSFGAGMLVSLGTPVGNMGVTSACVLLVFASHPLSGRDAALCGLLALGGGLFQTLLSTIPVPGSRPEPERLALAALYSSLAKPASPTGPPPASGKANAAAEVIAAREGDHSASSERYRALLDQAERIRVCITTLRSLRARVDEGRAAHVASLLDNYLAAAGRTLDEAAEMLRTGQPFTAQPAPVADAERILDAFRALPPGGEPPELRADILTQMDALTRQLRITFDLASHATPAGSRAYARSEAAIPWRLRAGGALNTLRANFNLNSTVFRHAVRLSVCVGAADAIGRMVGWYRPYWFPLTVVVVLKPDFSSTFSRGILRLAGTFAGLALATVLFHLLPRNLPVEIGLIMVATFALRWLGPAHYGVLALSVSELVVLLVALTGVSPEAAIMARARNTALGGVLALLAYWLWPTWERSQVGEFFARMLDAYRKHLELITRAFAGDSHPLTAAMERTRTAARLARTNFEASVDRLSAEPGTSPGERDRWHAILAGSYIYAHSVITLHAMVLAKPEALHSLGKNAAFQEFIRRVLQTLEALAAILRGRDPKQVQFPDLREPHYRLVHSGEPLAARHTLVSVETDKMVNSLNTLREKVTRAR